MRTSPIAHAVHRVIGSAVTAAVVLGSFTIATPPANAQTVASPEEVAAAIASTSIDLSKATNVAPVLNGRFGATFTVYGSPDTSKPIAKLTNGKQVIGRVVFTVVEDLGDWLKVNAPMRANKGIGYIQASILDNRFYHEWRLRIEVGARRLTLTKGATVILTDRVAIGKTKTPTPLGTYFTVDLIKPKKPTGAYGPFAYGLSAYSAVYQRFGAGDGRIGLHGTNEPSKIGQAVSNGCIRISNATILKLTALLPLGVPVDIVA
jgi:lipoprotein-anchoring transpeptidase ErfK/SrfK